MRKTFNIESLNKEFLNDRKVVEQHAIKKFKKVDGTITRYAIVYDDKIEMYSINSLQFISGNRIKTSPINNVYIFCNRLLSLGFKEI